ncbi:hypothetical protein C4D60_Mb00t05520 [Musa balbisiana]|uniref:Uncharacterized protein n=1 Tax=Musa balbisiana TaxID=52838 RepID=A0A4S8I4S4_MUSBA|nr:hypothetical protein C4D60_Mb00t05520 [Musa balbisiana]
MSPLTQLMSMSHVRTTADGVTRPNHSPYLGQGNVSVSVNPGEDRRLFRSRDRVAAFFPVVLSVGLPPVPPPPPLVGDFAQLPGSGYLMAGGNFLGRVISYVVNELVVEGLANNRAFQRFAVRTSKAIEDVSTKAAQARERLVAQLKDATKDDDSFRRP